MFGFGISPILPGGRGNAKRGNASSGPFATWAILDQIIVKASAVSSALSNHPVFINETILNNLPNDIWSIAINGGGDLRFFTDIQCTNRISCEVVEFNTSTHIAEIHVNVPSISSSVDTSIYIAYGKAGETQPATGAAYGRDATWDSDFLLVNHMNSGVDSTGNIATGNYSGTPGTGKVGQATDFNGSSDNVDYAALSGSDQGEVTLESWVNFDALSTGTLQAIISFDSNYNHWEQTDFADGNTFWAASNNPALQNSLWNYTVNTWQHTSVTYSVTGDEIDFRLNYDDAFDDDYYTTTNNMDTSKEVTLAAFWDGASFDRFLNGEMDEVRISKIVRSNAYLEASYINQNLTTDFLEAQAFVYP